MYRNWVTYRAINRHLKTKRLHSSSLCRSGMSLSPLRIPKWRHFPTFGQRQSPGYLLRWLQASHQRLLCFRFTFGSISMRLCTRGSRKEVTTYSFISRWYCCGPFQIPCHSSGLIISSNQTLTVPRWSPPKYSGMPSFFEPRMLLWIASKNIAAPMLITPSALASPLEVFISPGILASVGNLSQGSMLGGQKEEAICMGGRRSSTKGNHLIYQ